jgi:hypothetical protein
MPEVRNPFANPQEKTNPNEVQSAKRVDLALVQFTDEYNQQHVTLAVVGENRIHILEGRELGFSKNTTPAGPASPKLAAQIFALLDGKKDATPAPAPAKGKK